MKQISYIILGILLFLSEAVFALQVGAGDSVCSVVADSAEVLESGNAEVYERDVEDGFYFELMDIDVTVHSNHRYDVIEEFDACFVEPRHGIVREIPTRFWTNRTVSTGRDGSKYKMFYNRVDVENITVSEQYTEYDVDELKVLKIGSPEATMTGKQHYRITYTLQLFDDRVSVNDLLFHSIVGTGWQCSTDSVHFKIHLDKAIDQEIYDGLKVYVGPEGNTDDRKNDVIDYADENTIEGSVCELPKYWGVTVYLPLPEGYFAFGPKDIYQYLSWLGVGVSAILLIILIYKIIQGDKKVTSVITFSPKKDMTSADVGSLVDGMVNEIDLLSMIPWFASEGYLAISKSGKDTTLQKLKDLPKKAPDYQQTLFNAFFSSDRTKFELNGDSSSFAKEWLNAKEQLKKKYKDKLDIFSQLRNILLITTVIVSLTVCWSVVPPDGLFYGGGINIALFIIYLIIAGAKENVKENFGFSSFSKGFSTIVTIPLMAGALIFMVMLVLSVPLTVVEDFFVPKEIIVALLVMMMAALFLQYRLHRMTDYRREKLGEILGLREFIKTAELNELKAMVDKDERYFYRILPYAMAFGLVDKWAEKFKDLPIKEIQEYSYIRISEISTIVPSKQWRSNISDTVTKYQSRSSSGGSYSSGSSRGGYSGGGSGGGGGSSW